MKSNKYASRNSALDITRIFALFSVISVHFFRNSEFYQQIVAGKRMYLMCLGRTFFMICVPLFIVLTGYLMNKKVLCGKYYKGIIKTAVIYILASIACMTYLAVFENIHVPPIQWLLNILDFSGAQYSWYIEMYIGLFLIIPFLNLAYNGLESKKHKLILVTTLLALTTLPSICNIYDFMTSGWWQKPVISDSFSKIVPQWWISLYPVTYYFIGCYLHEFTPKINKALNLFLIIAFTVLFGSFNYYRSFSDFFRWSLYNDWGGFQSVVLTVLVFMYINSHNTDKLPLAVKRFLASLSDLCLGAYLVSFIFDVYAYPRLNSAIPDMLMRMEYYPVIVAFVFVCSLLLSFILNMIYKAGSFLVLKSITERK